MLILISSLADYWTTTVHDSAVSKFVLFEAEQRERAQPARRASRPATRKMLISFVSTARLRLISPYLVCAHEPFQLPI
jgi:hypothetical protein